MSKLQIFNIALDELGEGYLNSPDEDLPQAKTLRLRYDDCRRYVLEAYHWNFATKRIMLNRDAETPSFGFQYQYQLPSDYIHIIETKGDEETKNEKIGESIRDYYRVEGKKILTDLEELGIIYVYDCIDDSLFSQSFINSLGFYLAFAVSQKITGTKDLTKFQMFTDSLQQAQLNDAKQSKITIRRKSQAKGFYA